MRGVYDNVLHSPSTPTSEKYNLHTLPAVVNIVCWY